jgi:hypothetical protein
MDTGAPQPVVNERIASLMESQNREVSRLATLIATITTDYERRLRYLERTIAWALGGIGVISAVLMLASKLWK